MSKVRRVRVGNIEMEYEEAGSGERAFVLVHGYTGSRDDWLEQMPALAGLGRTIAIDQRGHGGSTNSGDAASYTLEQLVDDLVGFLDATGIDRCDLLGHSLGGMVALRFTLAHPERVASLVLMDTSPSGVPMLPKAIYDGSVALFRSAGGKALADAMQKVAASGVPHRPPAAMRSIEGMGADRYWSRIRAKLGAMDSEAFAGLGLALHDQQSVADRLAEISCPTLVMVGEEDVVFVEPAALLGAKIPDTKTVTVKDAAHSPQIENAAAWLAAIEEHLERARG